MLNVPQPMQPKPAAPLLGGAIGGAIGRQSDISAFVNNMTSKAKQDPGLQARNVIQGSATSPQQAQQVAFQSRLDGLNNWSKGVTAIALAGKQRQANNMQYSAKQQAKASRLGMSQPQGGSTVNSGGTGVTYTASSGGYRNGQIPANALSRLSFAPGHMLRADAAKGLEALNQAYRQAFGRNIGVSDSYRSLQGQINVARQKPGFAAKPGTSVHGLGLALDLAVRDPRTLQWLNANAGKFGFVNPNWAKNPRRLEPWHWEFTGGR